jgi:hypothetical protein
MAYEALRKSALAQTLTEVVSDLSDLLQKEVRLARAEIRDSVANGIQASVWMIVAGVLGLIAALLVVQGIVFGIASFGIALHWSCLIVAAALAAVGAGAFVYGRSIAQSKLTPSRSLRQVNEDIRATREQLT